MLDEPLVQEPLLEAATSSAKPLAKKAKGAGSLADKTANTSLSPKARTSIVSDLKDVRDHVHNTFEGISGSDSSGGSPKHDTHAKVKAAVASLETKIGNKLKAVKTKLEKAVKTERTKLEKAKEKKKSAKQSGQAGATGRATKGNQVKKPRAKQRSRSPSKTERSRNKSSPKA